MRRQHDRAGTDAVEQRLGIVGKRSERVGIQNRFGTAGQPLPYQIEIKNLTAKTQIGLTLLEAIKSNAAKELYVNPGAESEELLARAEALGLDPIFACSIVDIGERP